MKIGLIQINPVIGDFAGNCRKIRTFAQKAYEKGCRLAVFPEMVVSGYPPQDLLERRAFIEEHDRELLSLISELPPIYVLLGSIEKRNRGKGKHLYNSALGIHKGQIVFKARKRLLPSYDVFDEKRYFEPGPPTTLFEVDNLSFAVTVCEDIWHGEVDEYITDPVKELFTDARQQENKIEA
ncbi:MAG: NAD+ synthase, partial [Desulfobacteraceae bacterium]|nr:NAD+ synthase [Desulfobacteraceae bacterium]